IFLGALDIARARELSFEDRVRAQEAIERVYYSHLVDVTRPFAQIAPREVLDRKVRLYLKESAALERLWGTRITAEMLRAETERMAAGTKLPERLQQLYDALGNDGFVFQETVARAALADRLARSFYSTDARLHERARKDAEALRRALLSATAGGAGPRPGRR